MENRKTTNQVLLFLILVTLGIAFTRWNLTLFFGVDFVFGSIATFLILASLGRRASVMAAVLVGAYTVILWGHVYAFIALVTEALFVAAFLKRARYNITLATGFFWLILGIPLIFICYHFFLDLSWDRALLAAIKQSINEIFNAVIASLILYHTPLERLSFLRIKRRRSVFQTIFNIFVAAAVIPSFVILIFDSRKVAEQVERSIQLRLETISASISLFSNRWKDQHISMVQLVAEQVSQMREPTAAKLQRLVQQFRNSSPDLATLYISDNTGKTVAFDPMINAQGVTTLGLDFSDREYFNLLKNRAQAVDVTDVFVPRGGIDHPIIAVSAAIIRQGKFQGIVSSALDLGRLASILNTSGNDTNYYATIVDQKGNVISSNHPNIKTMTHFPELAFDSRVTLREQNFYQRWPKEKTFSPMARWSKSYIGIVTPLQGSDWNLYVEIPLAEQQTAIFHQYARAMSMLLVLILFILIASNWLASMISAPLANLSSQTNDLPEGVTSNKKSIIEYFWPHTEFTEIRVLVENFKSMQIELKRRFRELEMANRTKDEFLATLSHELRTPLNVIVGHAELLKQEGVANQNSLDAISRNALIQNQLVSDLLDISAIITGKVSFQPKIVSLKELAKTVVEGVNLSAEAKGVTLNLELTDCPCTVLGDSTRLHQVIWNLISNSIKFTPRGGTVTVRIRSEYADPEKGTEATSIIEVQDNGRGIEPDFLPYIFERFRQEDSTTTRRYGGLGLGLSIVRHLTELHGGSVQALSDGKGKGALFRVVLPFSDTVTTIDEPITSADKPTEENQATPKSQESLKGLDLLIIDDDVDSRELMDFVLQNAGAITTTAGSSAEALRHCKTHVFDLILSDIGLPDENGYTLIRKLRADSEYKSQTRPAIALTAYARAEDREQCLEAGFQDYLSKPVDIQKLIQLILKWVK